jgi:hypothetical protein
MEKMLCPTSKSMTTQRRRVCLGWRLRSFTAGRRPADAEQISINLQAVPSFEAFGQYLQTATRLHFGLRLRRWRGFPGSV